MNTIEQAEVLKMVAELEQSAKLLGKTVEALRRKLECPTVNGSLCQSIEWCQFDTMAEAVAYRRGKLVDVACHRFE